MKKKFLAEMTGTFVLVLMGCGAAVFNGGPTSVAAVLTIAFAFGLSVVAMAYAIGSVSGCHINPAITLGVWLSGRMSGRGAGLYMAAQVIGAVIASAVIWLLVNSGNVFIPEEGTTTGANGYAEGNLIPALIAEIAFTFIFVLVVLGVTDEKGGNPALAGLAIGLTLTLVHIVCIPITGTSVNPARSIGPALFAGGEALSQLWLFIVAPLIGAALSAGVWKALRS